MKIIEDCSPYYIRFTHPEVSDIVQYCAETVPSGVSAWGFTHHKLPESDVLALNSFLPYKNNLELNRKRFSLFITEPGKYYGAHKDGYPLTMFSINYPIIVQDSKCLTSWYSDADIHDAGYIVNRDVTTNVGPWSQTSLPHSREVQNFNKHMHVPIKTMTAQLGEGILFNTDIYHDWDNSTSSHRRVVLTLRHRYPEKFSFEYAKRMIFE